MGAPQEVIDAARASMQRQQDCDLFDDCLPAFNVFQAMSTQWRNKSGMDGGVSGLDYTALPFVMRMNGIAASQRASVFEDVRTMELETLSVIFERQKK